LIEFAPPRQLSRSAALRNLELMRTQQAFIIWLMLLIAPMIFGQKESKFTVLPESAAEEATKLCSRPGAPKFDGTWKPTDAEVKLLESRLTRISQLRDSAGARVQDPDRYYRQYMGIVVGKRKLIFINAFCDIYNLMWRERFVNMCDGGSCFWGAVYDVATGEFSDLCMNGAL
jgi:hypothetical protein